MSASTVSTAIPTDLSLPPAVPDLSGFDREYFEAFLLRHEFWINRLFRTRVEGLEKLDLSRPGMLAGNHNWGLWGITEVLAVYHAWYHGLAVRPPDLIGQGGPELQEIPLLRTLARRAGVVVASMNGMLGPLREGRWVLLQPGAVVDQGRPIWMRRQSRMKKVAWLGQRRVMTDQLGYIAAAAETGTPIYPVAWSGTHELAPILFESTRLLHWTGLQRMRRQENLPSFPITLNHFINLGLFLLSPLRRSPAGWAVFLALNIYFDPAFCYPVFPFQLRIKVGDPIAVPDLSSGRVTASERLRIYRELHAQVTDSVDRMLSELDAGRPWVPTFERTTEGVRRAYRQLRAWGDRLRGGLSARRGIT